ncbi:unnamed protein product [Prunus armeniaca]
MSIGQGTSFPSCPILHASRYTVIQYSSTTAETSLSLLLVSFVNDRVFAVDLWFYSGGLAGAREALICGVSSLCMSLNWKKDVSCESDMKDSVGVSLPLIYAAVKSIQEEVFPKSCLLDIEIPSSPLTNKGFKVTRQSLSRSSLSRKAVSTNKRPSAPHFMSNQQCLGIQLAQLSQDASAAFLQLICILELFFSGARDWVKLQQSLSTSLARVQSKSSYCIPFGAAVSAIVPHKEHAILFVVKMTKYATWSYKTEKGIFEAIMQGKLDLQSSPWPSISDSAKDVIKKMLTRDAKKRITAAEVLEHPWMTKDEEAFDKPIDKKSGIKQFNAEKGRGLRRPPTWIMLSGAPKQADGKACGYCVMRYVKEICEDSTLAFRTKGGVFTFLYAKTNSFLPPSVKVSYTPIGVRTPNLCTQMESENTEEVNGKGKSKQDYNAWTVEDSRMLLQLMVDAASRGWRDANGILTFRHSSRFGWNPTIKKFTAPKGVWKDYFKDLQIVIGNATAIGRNSLGLGDDTDARTFRVENRHVGIEDFVFDDESQAFIPNHNEPPH